MVLIAIKVVLLVELKSKVLWNMYSTVCALEFTQSYTEPYRVTCLLHMMATRHYIVYDMNTVVYGICVERNVCFIFS